MYTDEEKRVGLPLKTFILSLILIIIFILLLMWLLPMPKNSNNNNNSNNNTCNTGSCPEFPNLTGLMNRIFIENIKDMRDAAISYFTTDKLPKKVGDSVTLTLQDMLDKHLVLPLTDKNGDACDTKGSYVTLTKLKDSYELKVNLKCGSEEAYVIVPLGCYSYCPNGVCENKDKPTPIVPIPTPTPTPKPTPEPQKSDPSCALEVNGTLGSNGWYVSDATVTFKSKTTTNGAKITAFGLGTSSNKDFNGSQKYVVNSDGTITVYGYVKDSNDYTAICSTTVKRDTVKPSCDLNVLSGTKGSNGSYITDVVIGFASKTDATSGISNYGMSTCSIAVYNRVTKVTINTDGTHKVYGYVQDKAGNTAACDLTVKREKPKTPVSNPSCTLKVVSGTAGSNGWYLGNIGIGFASKTTTNGATITAFGLGTSETYDGNSTYTVSSDGTTTIHGYVKDSNGYTASCSITVKKDTGKPACSLKVTSGTYKDGYYTTDVVIGFASKTDSVSGISAFGIGKSTTYAGNTSYKITEKGNHTVYGYVKDKAGNTASCSITVVKKDNLEYQYKKDIAAKYSDWSAWTTYTYNPSSPPQFGKYALIEIVDLGKTQEIDYYKESTGDAIYKYQTVKVGTAQAKYCKGYDYFREYTTNKTVAVKQGTQWNFVGMVTTTGAPADTMSVKYEFVGFDWKCTGCERVPRMIWNKYNRTTYNVTSENTVTTSNIVVRCSEVETKTIEIFDTVKIFVDYQIIKTPVYKDVYRYQKRTRTQTEKARTDYQWSYYDNKNLLNNGYTYTGNTRVAG